MEDNPKPGYKFLNVILLESSFKRIETIDFEEKQKPTINVGTHCSSPSGTPNILGCIIEIKYESFIGESKVVEAFIRMAGNFERVGEPEISIEKFGKINAPALIFPFVREHLASLSTKAAMHTILLPPVNFVALSEGPPTK